MDFCERFGSHFRQRTRTVEKSVQHYVRGLLQAEAKNMERMEEGVPDADQQALHHMLSESAWSERAVLDQVAQDAHRLLGGHADSALLIDESGCPKKGTQSVGVARQWCGQLGKVENGQVGVFAALSRGTEVTLIDGRLFLPEAWTTDPARCQAAGIPKAQRGFRRKTDLALAMIGHARQQGIGFAWVGFDGFYGSDPAFLRALEDRGEVFVGDVHQDQRIDLDDPQAVVPPAQTAHGRPPTRLQAQTRRCGSTSGPGNNRPPPGNPSPCGKARKARCAWRFSTDGCGCGMAKKPRPARGLCSCAGKSTRRPRSSTA